MLGPRFEAPLAIASYPSPADEGRGWKYPGPANDWPMSEEPTATPSRSTSEPSALAPKATWAMPVTTSG